ncbi:malonate decarboxylase holo-ACP synthase [Moellerella wisconsensis]|uniref:Malonate decarboxylase holo-ACP synthase n=3 Tax=Gammaproteobacteria TaxID=1236 RepID=A0A9Q8PZ68_9GAMM|nr:malonate decarboxylase holo-ACP synthase [Moellerella wisconsensis]KLN96584.1 acid-shock protein [Moellerella wisconsensis]UNH23438.1 malonate decarboxylase holo-ACP synthase [Moellerella wisconsensis]UNH26518.1 malonate decarboxylase holo-ACP synthase [Moellerella wisconsensis]UNH29934.1 malonate decarboxylase holo-ACP synthase [Moellerella wisconsensis]UNH38159.1 malonate decarboxylase holo-ACP synthase [Moellerella wisconsensis]
MQLNPHDFVWINDASEIISEQPLPEWVSMQWNSSLPLIVLRKQQYDGKIVVGLRGIKRSERFDVLIDKSSITHIMNIESLVSNPIELQRSMFIALPQVQVLLLISQHQWPWKWGVIGSCAYTLVTDIQSMYSDSDLDVLIRCPTLQQKEDFAQFAIKANTPLCRIDIYVETPKGEFSLSEWFKNDQVSLKTATGTVLTAFPWGENI